MFEVPSDGINSRGEARTPFLVEANIKEIGVDAFNRTFALPLGGKGKFEVLYADEDLRIFRSVSATSGCVVQMREEILS